MKERKDKKILLVWFLLTLVFNYLYGNTVSKRILYFVYKIIPSKQIISGVDIAMDHFADYMDQELTVDLVGAPVNGKFF